MAWMLPPMLMIAIAAVGLGVPSAPAQWCNGERPFGPPAALTVA